ncbi:MAG: V-type ATP synthase subunit F [Flavonifractor sp.]|jgi:V/A-type H+-transporting ATPase subunit F|nr:V-type ATP synthase subunit F [Flavonifractor sp.]MCI9425635.1 V-type ATP synthase subunit F [Flavonifractor sp.]MCI9473404.1 V-type ATP synthase subunit F [Flavonifractor sp.]
MSDTNRYKIAVLGDKDSVLGFKALGLDVYPAETVEEARKTLHTLAKGDYAVVYLTEQYAAGMEADVARYKDELTPAVILIPGKDGSLGIGMANVKSAVERAVGADIL